MIWQYEIGKLKIESNHLNDHYKKQPRLHQNVPICAYNFLTIVAPLFPEQEFPTCQVRVVRFYVSCLLLLSSPLLSSPRLLSSSPLLVSSPLLLLLLPAGPQPRPSMPSVPCRTSTTTIPAQCSLPDLNHDHPRPVFPAGPQPRPSMPSVPCRTSTASIHAKCSLPDLNLGPAQLSVHRWTSTAR